MTINLPKLVHFPENVRLELIDMEQLQVALRQLQRIYVEGMLGRPSSPTKGWVIRGFGCTHSTLSLDVTVSAEEGIAFDGEGGLVYRDGSSTTTVTLPPSTTGILYAYMRDVESDQDERKYYDTSIPGENSLTIETRITTQVGFVFETGLSILSHVAVPGGQTVPVVPLYSFETDGTGILDVGGGSDTADIREMFGDLDDTFSFTTNPGYDTYGLRDVLSLLATKIQDNWDSAKAAAANFTLDGGIRDNYNLDQELIAARTTSVPGASTSASLKLALDKLRAAQITVGDGTNTYGDFDGAAGVVSAIHATGVLSAKHIHIRGGVYDGVDTVTFPQDGYHITGVPGNIGTSGRHTQIKPITSGSGKKWDLTNVADVTFEGIQFNGTSVANDWHIDLTSSSYIKFINCSFIMGASQTGPMVKMDDANHVLFENCTFKQLNTSYAMVQLNGSTKDHDIQFHHCTIHELRHKFLETTGVFDQVIVHDSYFNLTTGGSSVAGAISSDFQVSEGFIQIKDCQFDDNSGGAYNAIISTVTNANLALANAHARIEGNRLLGVTTTGIQCNSLGRPSIVEDNFIESSTNNAKGIQVVNLGSGSNASGVKVQGNEVRFTSGSGQYGIQYTGVSGNNVGIPMRFTGNTIKGADYGLYFSDPSNLTQACITENTFISCGQPIFIKGAQIDRVQIKRNRIEGGGGVSYTTSHSFDFCFGIALIGGSLTGVDIIGNHIDAINTSYTGGPSASILVLGQLEGVNIDGNTLSSNGTSSGSVSTGDRKVSGQIVVRSEGSKGFGVKIDGNCIAATGWGAGIYFDVGNSSSNALGVTSLKILNNLISNGLTGQIEAGCIKLGDYFDALGGGSTKPWNIDSLVCSDNTVTGTSTDDASYSNAPIDLRRADGIAMYLTVLVAQGNSITTGMDRALDIETTQNATNGAGCVQGNVANGPTGTPFPDPGGARWSVTANIAV